MADLLDAGGLSGEKLLAIHVHYLGLCTSADPRLKALGLKALDMAYKLKRAYAPERHCIETEAQLLPEDIERLTRLLREVQEFEHPELIRNSEELVGQSTRYRRPSERDSIDTCDRGLTV
jgi:hypothetical protein